MFLIALIKGIFVGLVVSVPTGPIGFLTVKRTITDGFGAGFATGLGAVVSDLVYGILIIIGLRQTSLFFETFKTPIHIIGGILLIILGVFTYFSAGKIHKTHKPLFDNLNIRMGYFLTSFFVTMLNPIQIISFTALLGSLAIFHNSIQLSFLFLGGLLLGSVLWWLTLSYIVTRLRSSFTNHHVKIINHIAGLFVGSSGVFILVRLLLS